jgi:hypothetical protein
MDQAKFLRGNMFGNCGPSSAESISQGAEQSLAQEMQSNYATRFADQQQVLDRLNQSLSPIVAAGPNQQGFSPKELANLNTQAINTTGAAARNATQAAQTSLAGCGGGGDSGLGCDPTADRQREAHYARPYWRLDSCRCANFQPSVCRTHTPEIRIWLGFATSLISFTVPIR